MKRSYHRQIHKLHVTLWFPKEKDAAFGLHGNMIAVWDPNLTTVGEMQREGVWLCRITA